jgi:lysozyme
MVMPPFKMSPNGRRILTERFEGEILKAYPDPGTKAEPWTIGYGHTGGDVYPGLVWTQDEADTHLELDLAVAERAVSMYVLVQITQNEADALIDFTYNEGAGNFHSSTLLRLLNQGDYDGAKAEFVKWDKAAGHVMQGLFNRRVAEAELFGTPDK